MKTNYFFKIGGISSIIQSLLYIAVVVAIALMPIEQITGNMDQFTKSYTANPLPLIAMSFLFVVLGLLGFLSVAPATAAMFSDRNKLWATIGKSIALLCLSVITIYFIWFLATLPDISLNNLHTPMNWIGWFAFGGMGLWVAIVGILVWVSGVLPRGFVLVCAIKTLGFWIILAGIIFDSIIIAKVGAVIGGLIGGPLYHTWLGMALLRKSKLNN